jgi:hypothetical protein
VGFSNACTYRILNLHIPRYSKAEDGLRQRPA